MNVSKRSAVFDKDTMKSVASVEEWKDLVASDINQAAFEFGAQSPDDALGLAKQLGLEYMVGVVAQLESNAAAEILHNLPKSFRNKIIAELSAEKAANLKEILSYPAGTAGALMSKEFLAIPVDMTIREAIKYLQNVPAEKKGKISYIYVVDKNKRLEGVIQIRDLIFHSPDTIVKTLLRSPVVQAETEMTQLDVAKLLQRHHYLGIPIVDRGQRLVGVVSADSVLKVYEKEAQDDIAKLVGTSPEEIRTHSVRKIINLRMPWLFVNIASGLICAYISGVFQNSLHAIVSLFLFVPIVLGLSESTGVQGATIVVRNIALGNKTFKNLKMLLLREIAVGISIGFICGLVVGAAASYWQANHLLGLALTVSMTTAIIISALIGLLMPVLFMKLRIDPAMASGPLVLAICDIQTLMVYFTVSGAIMKL